MPEYETPPWDFEQPKEPEPKVLRHQLVYSMWSAMVSWCPVCKEHFYNSRNKEHTIWATDDHSHTIEQL